MTGSIGYYVHHQGKGHLARALAIAARDPQLFVLLGTGLAGHTGDVPFLELQPDLPDAATWFDAYSRQASSLHYAPLANAGLRHRMATLAGWIEREKPGLIVCDVSVEIAMLARLTGTPSVHVRLGGERNDAAHLEAFRSARALLAPFHAMLDDPATLSWVRRKTVYCPGISARPAAKSATGNMILVVNGAGGAMLDGDAVAAAARATPGFQWRAIGPVMPPADSPENLTLPGWVENAEAEIANAALVIGAAGDGLVSAVIAAGKYFICLPQARPFNEQHSKAGRLQEAGAAITLQAWPPPDEWPGLIRRAMALDVARLAGLHDPDGANKAFEFLTSCLGHETAAWPH